MSGSIVLETLAAARDLGRLHEIVSVLVRHGMSDLVRRTGLAGAFERAGRILHLEAARGLGDISREEHVRQALEELGPTFVKAGQILSGRSDLLPPAWTRELSKLRESAAPVPIEAIRAQLVLDLGAEPEEVFRDFDPTPLAAASIAQVHRAKLADGTEVVLKVRRPGIREVVDADIRLMARLAELAERELPELARYRPKSLVRQASRSLLRELDLRNEARNAKRIASNAPGELVIPHVHDRWTCERLCVFDFLDGPSLGDWLRSEKSSPDLRAQLARQGADAVLEMVFVHGFFHADPHSGNVIVLPGGSIGLIDFGMTGSLTDERRIEFVSLLAAVSRRDTEGVVDVLIEWSRDGDADEARLQEECSLFVDQYRDAALGQLDTAAMLGDIARILRDNDLFLPDDVALLMKVFVTLEGMGKELDPDFVMSRHVEPFAREAIAEIRSPRALARRGRRLLTRMLTQLPRDVDRALKRLRSGHVGIDVDLPQLERFGDVITKSANRLTIGLVTAALIVGTAICTSGANDQLLMRIGFASSLVVGAWLVLSILRSGR